MKPLLFLAAITLSTSFAEVSPTIAHQGRLVADGLNYTGTAYFKFRIYQSDVGPVEPAVGEAVVSGGLVTGITLLHGGKGYTSAPTVTITAPTGLGIKTTATARANISSGVVTSFTMLEQGRGYTSAPGVSVAYPAGSSTLWSNSIDLLPGRDPSDPPPSAVTLPVSGGLYQVALGDTALTNMRALTADLVPDSGKQAWLRIWVGTERNGPMQELFPHQSLTPVPYARHAATATTADTIKSASPSTAGLLIIGGELGQGVIPIEGEGSRLMWYSAQRAFRAGFVDSTNVDPQGDGNPAGRWDAVNIGRFSTAMGNNTVASGTSSTALGSNTSATGISSFTVGASNTASHNYSAALGWGLLTGELAQTVVGKWNNPSGDKLFVVGGGTSDVTRSNVFSVGKNGDTITTGNATVTGNILHTGTLTSGGKAIFYGNAEFTKPTTFADAVTMNAGLDVNGPLKINAATTITGNASVTGDLSGRNLNLSQNFTAVGDGSVRTLTITGGADIAEPFDLGDHQLDPGSVLVIDEEHTGRLRESSESYDRRVAGVISGAGGIQPGLSLSQEGVNAGGHPVALAGRVYVKADASTPIRPGDLLTTSDIPGHAMRADDTQRRHGAILGKAMSALPSGRGLVLVLVSLQ